MNTNTDSVSRIAASLAGNPEMEQLVKDEIGRNRIVSQLLNLRVSKNLNQEDIAKAMNCHPSKISRIESGNDLDLKYADFVGYLEAMNVKTCMLFEDESLPVSEQIKQHVFRIHAGLEKLVSLARQTDGDDVMANKIHQFYGEVLFNFIIRYQESYGKLRSVIPVTQTAPRPEKAKTEPSGSPESAAHVFA